MKAVGFILISLLFIETIAGQTNFKSQKYGYSFTIPNGWRVKDQTVMPGTDVLVVDDRGNSFVVKVTQLPAEYRNITSISILENATNQELIELWAPTYDNTKILRRGTTIVDGKDFYFVHISYPWEDGLRLIHKMFMYNWKGHTFTLNCASISSMTVQTSVFFDLMLNTFRFPK